MGSEIVLNSKRQNWIDIAKGICILGIVLLHINFVFWTDNELGKYLKEFIGIFKVSLFFCISGLTLKEEKLVETKDFIKNKFFRLYLRVVLIGAIFVLLHNFFISIGFYSEDIIYSEKPMFRYSLTDCLKQLLFTLCMGNREVLIGPLWFGNVLFMALMLEMVVCFIINRLNVNHGRELRLAVCTLFMILSWIAGTYFGINIPRFNNTFSALFLIDYTQYLVSVKGIQFNNIKIAVCTFVLCFICPFFGSFSMNRNAIVNPIFFIVASSVFMYTIFYSSKKLEKRLKILGILGTYSFEIMVFQFLAFKIAALIMCVDTSFLVPTADNVWWMLYYLFFGIVVPIIIGVVINFVKKLIKIKKVNVN